MKFTKIKSLKGKPFNTQELASELVEVLAKKGFITEVKETNSKGFSLGINKASFFINTEMLGTNLRRSDGTLTGYKRTHIPTWNQRVEYNLTVQRFLNKKRLSCKVTSGCFRIKDHDRDYTENDWHSQNPEYTNEIIKSYPKYDAEEKAAKKAQRDANKPVLTNAEKFILKIKKEPKNGKGKNRGVQESDGGTNQESRTDGNNPSEAI